MPTKKVVTTSRKLTPSKTTAARAARKTPDAAVLRPSDDEIRLRAYQIFLQRNGHGGDPQADWLRAESELMSAIGVVTAARRAAPRSAAGKRSAS